MSDRCLPAVLCCPAPAPGRGPTLHLDGSCQGPLLVVPYSMHFNLDHVDPDCLGPVLGCLPPAPAPG